MVSVGASRPQRAVPLQEGFTGWSGGVETKTVFPSEEIAEIEAVHGLSDLLELLVSSHRGRRRLHFGHDGELHRRVFDASSNFKGKPPGLQYSDLNRFGGEDDGNSAW